jgi:hypothetical protein
LCSGNIGLVLVSPLCAIPGPDLTCLALPFAVIGERERERRELLSASRASILFDREMVPVST